MDYFLYPALRKIGIPFRPVTRITMGFVFAALAVAYAAIVQHLIYNAGPCYKAPLNCPAAHDTEPNHIHVAVQAPAYFFVAISEIFANITGLEYAFTKAPPSMKSFVMSIYLLQNAFGSALGIALSPTATDPKLIWMYSESSPYIFLRRWKQRPIFWQILAGICIAAAISGGLFWAFFHKYNATEESMNKLEDDGEKAVKASAIDFKGGRRRDGVTAEAERV